MVRSVKFVQRGPVTTDEIPIVGDTEAGSFRHRDAPIPPYVVKIVAVIAGVNRGKRILLWGLPGLTHKSLCFG